MQEIHFAGCAGASSGQSGRFFLLRDGTDKASVTAAFDIEASHPVWHLLEEAGIEASAQIICAVNCAAMVNRLPILMISQYR